MSFLAPPQTKCPSEPSKQKIVKQSHMSAGTVKRNNNIPAIIASLRRRGAAIPSTIIKYTTRTSASLRRRRYIVRRQKARGSLRRKRSTLTKHAQAFGSRWPLMRRRPTLTAPKGMRVTAPKGIQVHIPGCTGDGGGINWDYCYDPLATQQLSGGNDASAKNLLACTGDCDSDYMSMDMSVAYKRN